MQQKGRTPVLVGMIAISILVGLVLTGLLWAAGFSLLSALLWGYVLGGMATMVAMGIRMIICDRLASRAPEQSGTSPQDQKRHADT